LLVAGIYSDYTCMRQGATVMSDTRSGMRIPAWMAVLLVLAVVAAASYGLYHFWKRGPQEADSVVIERFGRVAPERPMPRLQSQATVGSVLGTAEYPEGMSKQPSGAIIARRGDAWLRFYDSQGRVTISGGYIAPVRRSWVTPQQWQLHLLAYRTRIANVAAQMKLTEAERKQVEPMFRQWEKAATPADKDAVASKLLALVGTLGTAHQAEAKAALQSRVQQIAKILRPEQIALAESK
jgi:hypothetical protein